MWFLQGRPDTIDLELLVNSLPMGYQRTSYQFRIGTEDESITEFRIAVPFPWTGAKENGSWKESPDGTLQELRAAVGEPQRGIEIINATELKFYDNARKLKNEPVDLINVGEMYQWYNFADFGYFTMTVSANKWYQIDYTHKISALSTLFAPCRLPTVITMKKPVYNFRLWVIGGNKYDLPKFLKGVDIPKQVVDKYESLHCYTNTPDCEWEYDVDIHTSNWDSSDDSQESDEEEVSNTFMERLGFKSSH